MTLDSELHGRLIRIMAVNTFAERYGFTQEDSRFLLDTHVKIERKTADEMFRRAMRAEEKAAALEEKTDVEQAALWAVLATTLHIAMGSNQPLVEIDVETFRQCMTASEEALGLPTPVQEDTSTLPLEVRSRTLPVQPTSAAEVPAPRVGKFSWGEGSHTSYLKKMG